MTLFYQEVVSHYEFFPMACNPAKGNEKGSVENGVGYIRRNYLSGISKFDNVEGINKHLENCNRREVENGKHYESKESLRNIFEEAKDRLTPLKEEHEWNKRVTYVVNSYQYVNHKGRHYSVPERYVKAKVLAIINVREVKIYYQDELIATHKRYGSTNYSIQIEHYLNQLSQKPNGIKYSRAYKTAIFDEDLIKLKGHLLGVKETEKEAIVEFINILKLGRRYTYEDFIAGIKLGLEYGTRSAAAFESIMDQLITGQKRVYIAEMGKDIEDQFDLSVYGTNEGETYD
jgi:hypothetical protein